MRLFILSHKHLNDDKLGYLSYIFKNPKIKVVGAAIYAPATTKQTRKITQKFLKQKIISILRYINKLIYNKIESNFHKNLKVPAVAYFKEKKIPVLVTSEKYDSSVIKFIKSKKPDAMFRIGWGLIKEPLLSLTPKGILSYHHGDLRKYRGIPPCFWQLYYGESKMKVTIQILRDGIDRGPIVKEKTISIYKNDTLGVLHRRAYTQTYDIVAEACEMFDNHLFVPHELSKDELGEVYTIPNLLQLVNFIVRVNCRKFIWLLIRRKIK